MPATADWFTTEVFIHHRRLKRYLQRRGLSLDDSEDVIQDAYIRLLLLPIRDRPLKTSNFLSTVTRNLMIDHYRRVRAERCEPVEDIEAAGCANQLDPEREVTAAQAFATLSAGITELSPARRQVYWLRRVHQCSLKETAIQLRISPHTVEQHLRRALMTLGKRGVDRPGRRTYRPARAA